MKKIFLIATLFLFMLDTYAQQKIALYNGIIPGSKAVPLNYEEESTLGSDGVLRVSKVSIPEMIVYLPKKPNGTAVIICPGGGYGILSLDQEGTRVAQKFNEIGITAFVLKYRLPSDIIMADKSMGPLQDALQAIYLVRKNASVWGVNPAKIGMMGFSAGGHLASSVNAHYNDIKVKNQEQVSLRPDFSILIYPVISFGSVTHAGSVKNLLGETPTAAQRSYFSSQNHVNLQSPPTFLVHANNDNAVPVKNSILYNEALTKFNIPAEMHIYAAGGHGFGLNNKTTKDDWFERLKSWMDSNNWL